MSELEQLRQEAEQLKNQIRVYCKISFCLRYFAQMLNFCLRIFASFQFNCFERQCIRLKCNKNWFVGGQKSFVRHNVSAGCRSSGARRTNSDAHASHTTWSFSQNLCHALGPRFQVCGQCIARRKTYCLGWIHDQQGQFPSVILSSILQ